MLMGRVVIGMHPHKRSATIKVLDEAEQPLLAGRRDELGAARTLTINRLHRLLVELVPGGAKKALTARQARALLDNVPAGDVVNQTRRRAPVGPVGRDRPSSLR